jgi:hypothetical protein
MVITGDLAVFAVGLGGGAANELLHWWSLRENTNLPAYAHHPFYWCISAAMIVLGGGLAWLQLGTSAEALVAFQIGLAAPMILQKLAKAAPNVAGAMGPPPASARDFLAG